MGKRNRGGCLQNPEALRENQEQLPVLSERTEAALREAGRLKEAFDREQESFSRISERVNTALALFERIAQAEKKTVSAEESFSDSQGRGRVLKKRTSRSGRKRKLMEGTGREAFRCGTETPFLEYKVSGGGRTGQ